MSMAEAMRSIGKRLPWMTPEQEAAEPQRPATPLEEAEALVSLTKAPGVVDRTSGTWNAVSRWAATELLLAQRALETAPDDRAAALRARCRAMRDLLAVDEQAQEHSYIEDPGPFVP